MTSTITRLAHRAGLRRSRPWYKLKRDAGPSPGLAEKNGPFSEKSDKKGSQVEVPSFRALRAVCVYTGGRRGRGGTGLVVVGRGEPITRAVSTYNHIAGRSSSREFVSGP